MKTFNQFDMEQQIMTCWNVCEDLETVCEGVLERDMSNDRIANVLLGMKELYQLKFEALFEQFESMLTELRDMKQSNTVESWYKKPASYDRDLDWANMNATADSTINSSTVTWEDHEPDDDFNVSARGEYLT